jgi:2-keto-4-pentenoate hydratase/2-oxohepta-3-ene-1,7-dioic acid hydratase in catechol pathway
MGLQIVRFRHEQKVKWGVINNRDIRVLKGQYDSLASFLREGVEEARTINNLEGTKEIETILFEESTEKVTLLSPVTAPARIICQGANYSSHREESGINADRPPFNLLFNKADSSLSGAYSTIAKPPHVKLLDYEIELGLVIGKDISGSVKITDENLGEYVAGLVIANDISARDVQISQGQWMKGKSYRTFCPVGPILYLLDPSEIHQIHNLELHLGVNDELRQSANTSQLLYKPAETLKEIFEIQDVSIGDLVLTGTPGGVAMKLGKETVTQLANPTLSDKEKFKIFMQSQLENNWYLKDGDVIRARIRSVDGTICLGEQINRVVFE